MSDEYWDGVKREFASRRDVLGRDLMARFDAIRFDRDNALADLGPEPRWWRPFARRRWWLARRDVLELALIMTELLAGKVARMRPDVKVQIGGPGTLTITGHGRKENP